MPVSPLTSGEPQSVVQVLEDELHLALPRVPATPPSRCKSQGGQNDPEAGTATRTSEVHDP
jgi:uncharacterized metal-binding protein YceD (DUF177 family)